MATLVEHHEPDTSVSHPFTCNTCQVAFRSSQLQRTHMRHDWHRYNLKRRVAALPPIAADVFTTKVLSAQATDRAVAAKASFERNCTTCQRTYYSENAYHNHVQSRNHQARVAALAGEMSTTDDATSIMSSTISLADSIDTTESNLVQSLQDSSISDVKAEPSVQCLFCLQISPDVDLNVLHMGKDHGLFIPERTYLVDLEGLLRWLWQRVEDEYECLYCHKFRNSADAARAHMRDLGHCRIAFEDEADMIQVGQFYDFSSTYDDDEWESEELSEDDGSGDEIVDRAQVKDHELVLPSGKVAGHRSLKRYFRQHLREPAAVEEEEAAPRERREPLNPVRGRHQVISRANGGLGMLGVSDAKRREVRGAEKRDAKRAQRAMQQYQWAVDKRGNSQKHFRDPLLQ